MLQVALSVQVAVPSWLPRESFTWQPGTVQDRQCWVSSCCQSPHWWLPVWVMVKVQLGSVNSLTALMSSLPGTVT